MAINLRDIAKTYYKGAGLEPHPSTLSSECVKECVTAWACAYEDCRQI